MEEMNFVVVYPTFRKFITIKGNVVYASDSKNSPYRKARVLEHDVTLRELFDMAGIDTGRIGIYCMLDGERIGGEELDRPARDVYGGKRMFLVAAMKCGYAEYYEE